MKEYKKILIGLTLMSVIAGTVSAGALTLELTDGNGRIRQLQQARCFMYVPVSCGACPPQVVTPEGIEVLIGSEKTTLAWESIAEMEQSGSDDNRATVRFIDGEIRNVELSTRPEQILSGDSAAGGYEILPLKQIRRLKVIRELKP